VKFDEINLEPNLLEAISYMGFSEMTPIQEKAIPVVLSGKDLIACAQTGTGKTVAYLLPVLNKLTKGQGGHIRTLILVPTRELAIQIEQQIQGLAYFVSVGSQLIYGGGDPRDWDVQQAALKGGVDIVVATPGKLISHLKMGYVDFSKVEFLIMDEADRMLDMGFYEDIMTILSHVPKVRQNLLFSATMPPAINKLARTILKDPVEIVLSLSKPAEGVSQEVYWVHDSQKSGVIAHVLGQQKDLNLTIIFCSTKRAVSKLVQELKSKKFVVHGFSSDFEQQKREEVLLAFRSGKIPILVATDVMSRGIDIKEINLVINYDVPSDAEDYVHRVGRTARASATGRAVTLVNAFDFVKIQRIEKLIGRSIPIHKLPEELGVSPDLTIAKVEKRGPRRGNFRGKSQNSQGGAKRRNFKARR
jgi:superfamily II DNA/RNA helicase